MALEIRREPRLHHPDVALVREHDALRQPGRTRRIEEHRGLAVFRYDRRELAVIEEAAEILIALLAEHHDWQTVGTILAARLVAEYELRAGIFENEMDGLLREAVVH